MTPATRVHISKLKRYAAAARAENLEVEVTGNNINIEGVNYGINDVDTLPHDVIQKSREERMVNGGLAYRGRDSIYSSFYTAEFELDGIHFNCAKQYYQYSKAITCNKLDRAIKISRCTDPLRIKDLGDKIKATDRLTSNRVSTLYAGTLAKFQQNPPLAIALISSGEINLYEATTDQFLGLHSHKWKNKEWSGENVSGRVLIKVRNEFVNRIPSSSDGYDSLSLPPTTSDMTNTASTDSSDMSVDLTSSTLEGDAHKNHRSPSLSESNSKNKNKAGKKKRCTAFKEIRSRRPSGEFSRASTHSSARPSNITDRSACCWSNYKQQLNVNNQKFLEIPGSHPAIPEVTEIKK